MFFWPCVLLTLVVIYYFIDWLIRLPKVGNYGNKHVLITGCRSGFGRELALHLDKLGFQVWATFHTENGMKAFKEESSSRVRTLVLDISDDSSIQAAYDTIRKELPDEKSLWAVVNNAGVVGPLIFTEMITRQVFMDVFHTNTLGSLELTRIFAPLLRKSKGRVIFMSSIAARLAVIGAPYVCSRFALEAAADIFRHELRAFGIKVSVLEPGVFLTAVVDTNIRNEQMRQIFYKSDPEIQNAYTVERLERRCAQSNMLKNMACEDISKVTNTYVNALTSKCPRTRYLVGADAISMTILSYMPTWISDFVLETFMAY